MAHYYIKLELQSLHNRINSAFPKGAGVRQVSDFRRFPSSFRSDDVSLGEQMRPNHSELRQEVLEPHIMCNSSQSKKPKTVSYNGVFLNDHIKHILLNFIWAAWPPKGIIPVWWGRYSACNNTCLRQWKVSELWISNTDTHTCSIIRYWSKMYQI